MSKGVLCRRCRNLIAQRTRERMQELGVRGGRPRLTLSDRDVIAVAEGRTTLEDIADKYGCSVITVRRRVREVMQP